MFLRDAETSAIYAIAATRARARLHDPVSPPRRHFRSFPVHLAALAVQSVQSSWARVPFFSSLLQSPSEPAQSAPHPLERPSTSPPPRTSVKVYNLDVDGAPDSRWIGAVDLVTHPLHSTSFVPAAAGSPRTLLLLRSSLETLSPELDGRRARLHIAILSVPRRVRVSPSNH